jgi:hypothetical protein
MGEPGNEIQVWKNFLAPIAERAQLPQPGVAAWDGAATIFTWRDQPSPATLRELLVVLPMDRGAAVDVVGRLFRVEEPRETLRHYLRTLGRPGLTQLQDADTEVARFVESVVSYVWWVINLPRDGSEEALGVLSDARNNANLAAVKRMSRRGRVS